MRDRRAALLRGINVGTAKRIAMADLRKVFEELGYRDVRTLLNSGNVAYTVAKREVGDGSGRIEKAIAGRLGVSARVIVLKRTELAAAVRENPLASVADNPSRLLLMVLRDRTAMAPLRALQQERWIPEALALGRRVAYLWCAEGIVDSRLWATANRVTRDANTARNLATMTKLLALVEEREKA